MKYPGFKIYSHLRYSVLIWICTVIGSSTTFAQNIYKIWWNGTSLELVKFDMTTCESQVLKNLADDRELGVYGAREISFHPDGFLYITTFTDTHHVFKIFRYQPNNQRIEEFAILDLPNPANQIAIFEEGNAILSSGNNSDATLIYEYNLRKKEIVREIDLPGLPTIAKNIHGIVKDNNLLFGTATDQNTTGIWYMDTQEFDSTTFRSDQYYNLSHPSIYYPACGPWQLISSQALDRNRNEHLVVMDTTTKTIGEWCAGFSFDNYNNGTATTTDFRQSSLRIDLDADNSSGHITAGYYDTLTTCRKEVPVMDDVELFTCEGEVDFISFRLKYFHDPLLPEEMVYSPDFPGELEQTSPGRYVWRNPYGDDESRIKEYLRSLRYRADWTDPDEKERVVMTTMHVGEDSTTSWSVYQLETDEVWAGRDTAVTYCPGGEALDLTDFLSAGVRTDGRIEEALSSGGTVFTPGEDEDGDYLYILEKENCADTAVLTVESLETGATESGLDTVTVCPGGHQRIGFPPGRYDNIEWWDGSTGDSVTVSAGAMTDYYAIVSQGDCGVRIPITVEEREVEGVAGRDTTIDYCGGGTRIDLEVVLDLSADYRYTVSPALSGAAGDHLVFDPSVDGAGSYLLIAKAGSCADTAEIILEETNIQELMLEPLRLCNGATQTIGLEPGVYEEVTWWNGDRGDSTILSGEEEGPFTVEAHRDGCVYQGEFTVTRVPAVEWPEGYGQPITLCEGDTETWLVEGLDSVFWDGRFYDRGEEIVITENGTYELRIYREGCSADTTFTVEEIADPSAQYSSIAMWCDLEPLTLTLPEDNEEWHFRWADGGVGDRMVESPDRYPFVMESNGCEFTGYIDVLEGTDCDEECPVSLPNAITPNGDGVNDELELFSPCEIQVIEFRVFDKWGGELYRVENESMSAQIWENIAPGVYMVQISYETDRGEMSSVAGGVMVIK